MRIRVRGRNNLFTFRNDEGQISSVNLADFSGRINFRQIVRDYLKEEAILFATRPVETGAQQFLGFMKRPLSAMDILKLALRVETFFHLLTKKKKDSIIKREERRKGNVASRSSKN